MYSSRCRSASAPPSPPVDRRSRKTPKRCVWRCRETAGRVWDRWSAEYQCCRPRRSPVPRWRRFWASSPAPHRSRGGSRAGMPCPKWALGFSDRWIHRYWNPRRHRWPHSRRWGRFPPPTTLGMGGLPKRRCPSKMPRPARGVVLWKTDAWWRYGWNQGIKPSLHMRSQRWMAERLT